MVKLHPPQFERSPRVLVGVTTEMARPSCENTESLTQESFSHWHWVTAATHHGPFQREKVEQADIYHHRAYSGGHLRVVPLVSQES